MNRGIVMEADERHVIVLTPDGQFKKLAKRRTSSAYRVGEEIRFPRGAVLRSRKWYAFAPVPAVVAAVLLLLFSPWGLFANDPVVAYVSLDMNPSVELGIDRKELVIEGRGINESGAQLLNSVTYAGLTVAEAAEIVVGKAAEQGLIQPDEVDIVIATTIVRPDSVVNEHDLTEKISGAVRQAIEPSGGESPEVAVSVLSVPREVREEAVQQEISAGKLAIYLIAKSKGADVTLEKVKSEPISSIVGELGGMTEVSGQAPSKETLKELLQQEQKHDLREPNQTAEPSSSTGSKGKSGQNLLGAADSKGNGTHASRKNANFNNQSKANDNKDHKNKNDKQKHNEKKENGNKDKKQKDSKKNDNKKNNNKKNDNKQNDIRLNAIKREGETILFNKLKRWEDKSYADLQTNTLKQNELQIKAKQIQQKQKENKNAGSNQQAKVNQQTKANQQVKASQQVKANQQTKLKQQTKANQQVNKQVSSRVQGKTKQDRSEQDNQKKGHDEQKERNNNGEKRQAKGKDTKEKRQDSSVKKAANKQEQSKKEQAGKGKNKQNQSKKQSTERKSNGRNADSALAYWG